VPPLDDHRLTPYPTPTRATLELLIQTAELAVDARRQAFPSALTGERARFAAEVRACLGSEVASRSYLLLDILMKVADEGRLPTFPQAVLQAPADTGRLIELRASLPSPFEWGALIGLGQVVMRYEPISADPNRWRIDWIDADSEQRTTIVDRCFEDGGWVERMEEPEFRARHTLCREISATIREWAKHRRASGRQALREAVRAVGTPIHRANVAMHSAIATLRDYIDDGAPEAQAVLRGSVPGGPLGVLAIRGTTNPYALARDLDTAAKGMLGDLRRSLALPRWRGTGNLAVGGTDHVPADLASDDGTEDQHQEADEDQRGEGHDEEHSL